MRITIFGGHGKIALLLAPLLVEAGHEVTSVIRNPDHVADVEATGATAVVSSVEDADADTLAELLSGQDAVVWSAGAGGGNPERTYAVDRDAAIRSMDAAAASGVGRYVMVSFSGSSAELLVPEDDPFRHYQDAKIAADEHLRSTELDWTILGPGTLTLEPSRGSVNPDAAFNDGDETSRELVAQVALAVIDDPRASRKTLVFGDGDVPIDAWLDSL
ncbi:SDR family oxidoreductase [Nocardioides sp.]|uniref:SDR family oxidoreductase n=1 Tax=Nocardioides sp. TaxID=35761 RepID=UPI00261ECEA0|nr:SDR family oxidoreductase [Nocardioides sp.]MCW2736034.1 putative NADH-flavin reductase [Nocardioides sp.]